MANKRKLSNAVADEQSSKAAPRPRQRTAVPLPANLANAGPPPLRRQSTRTGNPAITNPDVNPDVVDGLSALRASPDGGDIPNIGPAVKVRRGKSIGAEAPVNGDLALQDTAPVEAPAATESMSSRQTAAGELGCGQGRAERSKRAVQKHASAAPDPAGETMAADLPGQQPGRNKRRKASQHVKVDSADANNTATIAPGDMLEHEHEHDVGVTVDPEDDTALPGHNEIEDEDEVKEALSRPPPVNSDYLPLPWKGRLGYVRTLLTLHMLTLTGVIGVSEHLLA